MKYFSLIMVNKFPSYCLMLVFLFTGPLVFCSPVSNNSTTNWNTGSGWTPTGVPNLLIWDGSQDVIVSHNKTAGNLTIKNGNSIRVTSGTVLTINGNLTLGNRSSIAVDAGAVLIITGSLLATNSPSSVIIDGTLNVGGNYSVQTSAVVHEHKGLVTVGGNLSVIGNTNIKILGGAVAITGKLKLGNNGVMSGCSGRVTYGSYDINSCGFSYLKCCSDKRGTGCSNTPPPAKGMDFSNCAAPPPCNSIGGTVTSNNTVCAGSNSGTINLIGYNGSINRWEKTTNDWVTTSIVSNTTNSLTYSNISSTTKYRAVVRDGACPEAISSEVTITVDAASVGGNISSSTSVCSGENSGTLSLSGQVGDIIRWEKSTNNWSSKSNISNTTSSQNYTNLTTTTKYRAILKSGVCSNAISNDATITVNAESEGGTLSSNATVCSGENSGTLSLSGQTGDVVRWEKSVDNWVSKTNINNTLPSQDYTNLTATTQYRAILQSGVCLLSNSNELIITVDAESIGGNLSSSSTSVCFGTNLGTISLSGQTGDLIRWEKSTNNWASKTDIYNTSPSQNYTNLEATTQYRAILQSGVCSEKSSTELEVLVNTLPNVYIGKDTSICIENPFIVSAGPNGSNYLWNDASIFETLRINKKGIYSVIVTDVNNCVSYDTISVDTFPSPKLNMQLNDTVLCLGDSVLLSVDPNFSTYVWMNSSSTSHQLTVKTANTYILKVYNSNDCIVTDTAKVSVNNLPDLELGGPTQLCQYKDLYVSVSEMNANYQWSTGETIQTIKITNSGKYWANVLDTNNCFKTDTIVIYDGVDLDINLGDDTTICSGSSLVLDAGSYTTEIWQGEDTASEFLVNSALNYDVLVINDEGCFGMDTVLVEVSSIPKVKIVQEDSLKICEFSGDEIELTIQDDEGMQIEWSSGDEGFNANIYSSGQHIVSKINQFYCVGTDTITILPYCRPVVLTMPNIITPNGDMINDYHIPLESSSEDVQYIMSRIKSITYSVRNRWGILIHFSEGELPSWNGNDYKSGKAAAQGTYFWVLSYEDASGGNFKLNGFVDLSR